MTKPYDSGKDKDDAGKNRLGMVLGGFAGALEAVGLVGTYGATKYSDGGWKSVENGVERYNDAMMRHWIKKMCGGKVDKESGLAESANIAWNALAVLQLELDKVEALPDNLDEDCGL